MVYAVVILCGTQYTDIMTKETSLSSQLLELRRGVIVLATLSQLQTPRYGYGLLQSLEQSGVAVDAGTLYPLMRRLEKQGVLESYWDTADTRPRKYYQLSSEGRVLYTDLLNEWRSMTANIQQMTQGDS